MFFPLDFGLSSWLSSSTELAGQVAGSLDQDQAGSSDPIDSSASVK